MKPVNINFKEQYKKLDGEGNGFELNEFIMDILDGIYEDVYNLVWTEQDGLHIRNGDVILMTNVVIDSNGISGMVDDDVTVGLEIEEAGIHKIVQLYVTKG
jgi:hypothetical protein